MKKAIVIAAIFSAVTAFAVQAQNSNKTAKLIEQIDDLSDRCISEKPGNSCEEIKGKFTEARKLGLCLYPVNERGNRWHPCGTDFDVAQAPEKRHWYAADTNKSSCIQAPSPADKIREIQSFGQRAETTDLPGGAVEVATEIGGGKTRFWTFFPTHAACHAKLPRSQPVDRKYE